MSYEWIRRRQRYLGFRYLFPEFVAPWIQCRRGLLRIVWFFTHPLDEFFETIGEILAWPFVALATMFGWMSAGIRGFFGDLFRGVEVLFRSLGRLPVWTGAAIAGSLGVILTTLLFFLTIVPYRPVPASIARAPEVEREHSSPRELQHPQPDADSSFDPFADASHGPPQAPAWQPEMSTSPLRVLSVQIERLSLPPGWDSRVRHQVVSATRDPAELDHAPFGYRSSIADGWSLTRTNRAAQSELIVPYVSRHEVQAIQIAPSWVTVADNIGPFQRIESQRHPAVTIARSTPSAASAGGSLRYELIVNNQGTEPLDSVIIEEVTSALDRVLSVDPPAKVVANSLVWNLTSLEPGEQRRLSIELQPDRLRSIAGDSIVQVTTGVSAATRVSAPRPEPLIITPEPQELIVTTPPPQTEPQDALPEPEAPEIGMILPTFDDEPVEEPVSPDPGSFWTFIPDEAEQPQRPTGTLMPVEDDFELAVTPARGVVGPVTTVEDVPIHFKLRTPKLVTLDAPVPAVFEVRNPGTDTLTGLVIQVHLTDELNHQQGRVLQHRIARLPAGEVYRTRLTTTAVGQGIARLNSKLTLADDVQRSVEAAVEVNPKPADQALRRSSTGLPRPFTCGP